MFDNRTQRVAFATGILFILGLAVFGTLFAVASMSMDSGMTVMERACKIPLAI